MLLLGNVSKTYNGTKVIDELNLNIEKGQIYALLGSNGAGKTSTINILLGFIKADSGTIKVDGLDPSKNLTEVRKRTAYIPENVSLYPYLSGSENLDYFSKLAGINLPKEEQEAILTKCGLDISAHHKSIKNYSKGMRQKVGIAIAYAKKAKILLLDEPSSGLDPSASNELTHLLKELSSEGTTILMASHDLFRVRETSNRIGIINKGKLLDELDPNDISANDLEGVYLNYMKN